MVSIPTKDAVLSMEDLYERFFWKYVEHVEIWVNQSIDVFSGARHYISSPARVSEKFLESIESFYFSLSEIDRPAFRRELVEYKASHPDFGPASSPPLFKAIKLLASLCASHLERQENPRKWPGSDLSQIADRNQLSINDYQ